MKIKEMVFSIVVAVMAIGLGVYFFIEKKTDDQYI